MNIQWCEICERLVQSIVTVARVTQRERPVGLIKVCPRCARALLKLRVIDEAPKYMLHYADYVVVVRETQEPHHPYIVNLTTTQARTFRVRGYKVRRMR